MPSIFAAYGAQKFFGGSEVILRYFAAMMFSPLKSVKTKKVSLFYADIDQK